MSLGQPQSLVAPCWQLPGLAARCVLLASNDFPIEIDDQVPMPALHFGG